MELIRGVHNIRPRHKGCVATIGNFDGVHLGHQAVIGQLAEKAAELCLPSLVMLFEPQPQEFFAPQNVPARLTRFREKMQTLRRFALDRVLCIRFDRNFSAISAQDFISGLLVDKLGVRYLVVGDDFRFGKGRVGDFAMLLEAGKQYGFQVANMHSFLVDRERVSSTRIRVALNEGDLNTAEKLLGRPFRMSGRVAHGDKRGRKLGFPTANIHLHRKATPVAGVFAVEMLGIEGEPVSGVANVGTRPTVNGSRCILEVHLFDFNRDIYGRHVHVNFLKKLRDEMRFSSLSELEQQILEDSRQARMFFADRSQKH
jgi:riboflavin kinase/FMN adenylyltransferase